MTSGMPTWVVPGTGDPADRWQRAGHLFDTGDHIGAARVLEELVAEQPEAGSARLLLARARYHSAQLGRAEQTLRELLRRDPADGYARLLLGRTLQRAGRHDEAAPQLRMAAAMGVPAG